MLAEVRTTLAEIDKRFPAYKGQGTELAGFVWFQGWNDHINGPFADAYEANLLALIQDLRKDLNAPQLPVVLGQMGQCGFKPPGAGMKKVNDAMAAAGGKLERVKVVATAPLWDAEADKLYPTWRENKDAWDKVGSDHGYHYLGSVRFFCRAGRAFAEAMLSFK
jgi:alpha-galactosidase